MGARTDGADGETGGAHPELVLGLRGQRAGEGSCIAGAFDGRLIAGNFALLVDAAADPVERGTPPQEGQRDALAQGREHVVAADVGVFVLEQSGHAGRAEGDRFGQDDGRTQKTSGHRARRICAHHHADALEAFLECGRQVCRAGAGDEALHSDKVATGADEKESCNARPDEKERQADVRHADRRQRDEVGGRLVRDYRARLNWRHRHGVHGHRQ